MSTISQLIEYGFTGREAQIYLCVLKNLEASAYVIAHNTGIPRATVYSDLENLKKKGYISSSKKNGVLYFSAESLNRFKKNAEEKLSLSEALIPQLRSLVDIEKFNPNVKSYIGVNGLKLVFEDMLETMEREEIKQLYAITDIHLLDTIPRYLP